MINNNIKIENKYHYNFNYLSTPREFDDLILLQLGEIYCENGANVEKHTHDEFFEITYVISGKGIARANGIPTQISQNELFISLPNETHEIISDSVEPLRYYFIAFNFKQDSQFHNILYQEKIIKLNAHSRIAKSSVIGSSFAELISQLENPNEYSNLKFQLLCKVLAVNVIQIYKKIYTKNYNSPIINNDQVLYHKIISFIDNNLTKIDKLSDIAEYLNYNYVYISRIFKKKFGKTIYTYFSDKKLELAKQLITNSDMSLTEISTHLNYSSIFVFSRIFKNKYGISPNSYREKYKKN